MERRLAAIVAADVVGYVAAGTILYGRLADQSRGISNMRLSLILLPLIGLVIVLIGLVIVLIGLVIVMAPSPN